MAWFSWLKKKEQSAAVAKDRLQIIVARERTAHAGGVPGYLPQLQQELLQVIAKYENVDLDLVTVNIDKQDAGEVLELNIPLSADDIEPPPSVRNGMAYA